MADVVTRGSEAEDLRKDEFALKRWFAPQLTVCDARLAQAGSSGNSDHAGNGSSYS